MIKFPSYIKDKNKGLSFESKINKANEYYKENNIALIYKKPTPIKIISIDNETQLITKAAFESKSTTDYNVVFNGKYIDFEAKSTHSKTSLPLKNIEDHQIEHIKNVLNFGGISFLLVEFSALDEIYLLKGDKLLAFLDNENRSSIPLTYFKKEGFLVPSNLKIYVDYLSVLLKRARICRVFDKFELVYSLRI